MTGTLLQPGYHAAFCLLFETESTLCLAPETNTGMFFDIKLEVSSYEIDGPSRIALTLNSGFHHMRLTSKVV